VTRNRRQGGGRSAAQRDGAAAAPDAPLASGQTGGASRGRRIPLLWQVVAVVALLAAGVALLNFEPAPPGAPPSAQPASPPGKPGTQPATQPATAAAQAAPPQAAYVGGAQCVECHAQQHAQWQGSQHAVAMQPATERTVLGDFRGAKLTYAGVTSTFFRRDGRFFVNTDGPDGKLADFEISYTFGIAPLQQYLVDFPGGRKQALGIAWDSRPAAEGGQRWFHLYPGQNVRAGDSLHWTGIDQNWNYQCADCHSTNLRKNFDEATGRFATTWTDISVGCEACHGPGSLHLAWARKTGDWKRVEERKGLTVALDERQGVQWIGSPSGNAQRSRPRESAREIEVCARCHARRGQFSDAHVPGEPFTDAFRPALLEPGLYYPDGQMLDEVYNHGSFLQSRMNAAGVTCSDCHDPHTQKLRAPGNGVCAQCHAAERFDAPAHHHHAAGSKGAQCAACHMPTRTYMVVDPRHDHSMRIPRPDRSESLGVPNACNDCHRDRKAAWAAEAISKWFPDRKPGFQGFAESFAGVRRGDPAAFEALARIATDRAQPAIVRASAVARLSRLPTQGARLALRDALGDPDPVVRSAAVNGLDSVDPGTRTRLLVPMLDDGSRLVRMEAARALAGTGVDPARLARASAELEAEFRFNADRPETQTARGNLAAARGDASGAIAAYRKALAIDPGFSAAAVNLADAYRAQGDERLAEETLRAALARDPRAPGVHHALGLALVRQKRMQEALTELGRASELAPDDARFAYVYATALFETGRRPDALSVLDAALLRNPGDAALLHAAAYFRAQSGDRAGALRLARRLQALDPQNPQLRQFAESLEQPAR